MLSLAIELITLLTCADALRTLLLGWPAVGVLQGSGMSFAVVHPGCVAVWDRGQDAGRALGAEGFGERLARLAVVVLELADARGGGLEPAQQRCRRCALAVG